MRNARSAVSSRPPRGLARRAAVGLVAALALAGLAGCAQRADAANPIEVGTAYVPVPRVPGTTVAYVVIRNNGPADRLVSARTSAGGRVFFQVAADPGATAMRTVPAVRIPANATVAMVPDGLHMVLTGVRPLHGGKHITLTLVFAHAGAVSVVAQITNPQTGGSSYFVN
jgi:copper(I)-binding protein